MDSLASSIEVIPAPFQWGPIILVVIGIVVSVGGYFIKRLVNALDEVTRQMSEVSTRTTVIETLLKSDYDRRITKLEKDNEKERNA